MTSMLLALKIGLFLPSQGTPMKGWFYLTTNVLSNDSVSLEAGVSPELIKVTEPYDPSILVGGRPVEKYEWFPSYVFNLVKVINDDVDLGMGARYRTYDKRWLPQLSLSFKFSSLQKDGLD